MREILFKAKTEMIVGTYNCGKEDCEWVKGHLRCDCGKWLIYQFEYDRADYVAYEVNPETICQYTGLTDKNGQKIWENDVVQYCDCTVENYVIAWEADKACFEYQQYGCSIMNFDELSGIEVEVIGNIFDNPELLNE